MNIEVKKQFDEYKKLIEQKLDEFIPIQYPEEIWDSMRYSVLAGGKRLRPLLTLETCKVISGSYEQAIPTACAIEMLHSQSLIHDDLPCMDNDDYRRGKPTNHKVFGESTAVLAGDALLSFAPQIIIQKTPINKNGVNQEKILKVLEEFLVAAGAEKLIAGQVVDLASEGKQINEDTLNFIHRNKTGALFKLAMRTGAMLGNANEKQLQAVTEYAEKIGLAFQIMDDILDVTSTLEELGKTPGKDEKDGKVTYISFYGLETSKAKLSSLCEEACAILEENNIKSDVLKAVAESIYERIS